MNPYEVFFVKRDADTVEGPYDLVQMGQLLVGRSITADTMVRVEGSPNWQPFIKFPQYEVVRETSVDSAARLSAEDEKAEVNAPLIPLPSKAHIFNVAVRVSVLLLGGFLAYLSGWYDPAVGTVVLLLGLAVAAVAQCLILGRILNEDYSTIGKVWLVPLYDIYFFGSNLDNYFSVFFAKYLGWSVIIGAAAGMGELNVNFHH